MSDLGRESLRVVFRVLRFEFGDGVAESGFQLSIELRRGFETIDDVAFSSLRY